MPYLSWLWENWRVLWPVPWINLVLALVAVLCGLLIGGERQHREKPAGLRTLSLVCLGSAVFTMLSFAFTSTTGDSGRVAAQIVTGIGFLGAGAILQSQGSIIGLTTAATIWAVAAIGVAVGAGHYVDGLGATLLIIVVLVGLRPVEQRLLAKRRRLHVSLRVKPGCSFDEFERVITQNGVHITSRRTFEHDTDRTFELELIGSTKQFDVLGDLLREQPNVVSVSTD
jgi:uncharacterized membrane protein YhiD involved in acid resistance